MIDWQKFGSCLFAKGTASFYKITPHYKVTNTPEWESRSDRELEGYALELLSETAHGPQWFTFHRELLGVVFNNTQIVESMKVLAEWFDSNLFIGEGEEDE